MIRIKNRWVFLALACLAIVLSLTTWFSATAVIPELKSRWNLDGTTAAWLTNGVQAGFVAGAVSASVFGLFDRARLNVVMSAAALLAALSNLALLVSPGPGVAIVARLLTGLFLSAVYPPSIKLMATWFRTGRGIALGLLIGALTLGSAMPHLIRGLGGGLDWRVVVLVSSGASLLGAMIFALVLREGPFPFSSAGADARLIGSIWRNKPVMLMNLGYFGHMWELYAMWSWFLAYSGAAHAAGNPAFGGNASLITFSVLAVGALGCILGGLLSDRIGRCATTALAMSVSGLCSILIGFAFAGPAWLFLLIALVWGIAVIADSAQFSAGVTELAQARLVGSALALQMGIGFAITIAAIWIMPLVAAAFGGWRWAFIVLAPGPLVGTIAVLKLRSRPESVVMAHGRR